MPTRSPGTAGRSTGPGAPSYSNTCFQTGEGRVWRRRRGCIRTKNSNINQKNQQIRWRICLTMPSKQSTFIGRKGPFKVQT
uniref:Uncharacterized protein n=1 Tax=Cyprinodon variegatus TaxID=28743 RepID=A0A3Q2CFN3_CYPVA